MLTPNNKNDRKTHALMATRDISDRNYAIVPNRQPKLMVAVRAPKNANLGTARHWHDRDQMHFHTTTAIG
jgi:hypothetical protein